MSEIDDHQEWWMLSAPLEVAVMNRMGLKYPTAEELAANGYKDTRPLPDSQIVREELAKLEAGVYSSPDIALSAAIWGAVLPDQDDDE